MWENWSLWWQLNSHGDVLLPVGNVIFPLLHLLTHTHRAVLHVACRLLLPFLVTSPNLSSNSLSCLIKNYTRTILISNWATPPTPLSLFRASLISFWAPVSPFPSCNLAISQMVVMLFIICIIHSFVFPWPSFQSFCHQDAAELPTQKCLERRQLLCL